MRGGVTRSVREINKGQGMWQGTDEQGHKRTWERERKKTGGKIKNEITRTWSKDKTPENKTLIMTGLDGLALYFPTLLCRYVATSCLYWYPYDTSICCVSPLLPHWSFQTGVILAATSICAACIATYTLENNILRIKHKKEHLHTWKKHMKGDTHTHNCI